jgi:hypothetical protein
MYNMRYADSYANFIFTTPMGYYDHSKQIAAIEITTRSGKGPFVRRTAGTYLYKTLPFTLAKQFYRPRYTVKNIGIAPGTDLRSTIHWEPNVVTDEKGNASVSFFSADKSTGYTIILEGTDLEGNLGYNRQQIKIVR